MTEYEFDRCIEAAAQRFERRVEEAADRLDRGVSVAWHKSRTLRITLKSISLAAEAGLTLGAARLAKQGHHTAAFWCFILGAAGLAADIVTAIAFRRR